MSDSTKGNLYALVIDDEPNVREYVAGVLQEEGWTVAHSASAVEALGHADEPGWSAIFCSVSHARSTGYDVLRQFKEKVPDVVIVLVAGHGSAPGTIDPTAYGAYDYLLKPFGPEEMQSLTRALRTQFGERPQRPSPTRRAAADHSDLELVGRSQAYFEVLKHLNRVSNTNLPVLLTGEAGTGKEIVAAAIHQRSERRNRPFISLNCSSIPADAIEATVFGYVQGAFPGTDRDKRGLWEEADGGTLFINEIASTSPSLQDKLLRAWQTGEIARIGSDQRQRVNVRVIAASSRSVEKEVAAGRFRNDLFYRLGAVSITLPPLRERPEDIPPLAQSFADRVYRLNSRARFSTEALTLLTRYNWPGNLRELEQAVVCAVSICEETVQVKDLPQRVRAAEGNGSAGEEWVTLSKIEGRYVARVLEHTRGNKQAAARVLAIDRKTLDRMIKRHQITPLHTRAHRAKASGN
ncbi:MAG TPA: sigma-54 dependent transcriptional regulator [Pyrinomonadaceae bacterium]|nr:sigma-54 dependent transcriptional regulator [Pyrinomonadaceae bacterium]